jgi:hypothetical protein
MSFYTVHEKDGNEPGQLTVFSDKELATLYKKMRENHQKLMFPFKSQRPEITEMIHTMPVTFKLKSGMQVFTAEIYTNFERDHVMFSSEREMGQLIENYYGNYKFVKKRTYKIMYISSELEAIRYAETINELSAWRIKLGTVSRFGKKNCIISIQDMENIGFDPASETVDEFIAWMRPIASKMYDLAKKQLHKLNPDRLELNYFRPDEDLDE